ncbi:MAG TPA: HEAT repeat domain-containing protein [Acidimicrobiia bacterium]|nr:HEAT repeat domain-containing protein [Acidimicrobiia bacterium]
MSEVSRKKDDGDVRGLIDSLAHRKKGVRAEAASALGDLADPMGIASLVALLGGEPEPSVRTAISLALRPFDGAQVIEALAARVSQDTADSARSAAAWSLIGKRKDHEVCETLVAVMTDESAKCSVRRDTALALGCPPDPASTAAIERILVSARTFRELACWSTLAVAPTLALWESQPQLWGRLFEANMTKDDEVLFTINLGDTVGCVALADRWIIGWHRNTLKGIKAPSIDGWVVRYQDVAPVEYSCNRFDKYFIDFRTGPLRITEGQGIRNLEQAVPYLDWLRHRNDQTDSRR